MMTTLTSNWSYPTTIWFGAGRIAELAAACHQAGIKKPLLVTDKGLADLPITQNALASLAGAGVEAALFAEVDPNPTEINMEAGLQAYKAGQHDGVIAFGGGSGLDLGKMVAFMAGQTRPVWDFEDIGDWWTRANADVIAPIIAVPTTAGTGSEVGRASVITNSQTAEKKIIFHPKILPTVVICDPQLTVGMPDFITAGTGMDAFAHCLEAFSSPHYHPMSQGIALEGMRLVKENLTAVYNNPDDITGRAHMMSAAMMGATAFQKGLGAIHALSHPIGAIYHTHHGTTNAVVMQAVMRFNSSMIESRCAGAARYLGIEGGFDGFYDFVGGLVQQLNIPKNLTDLGLADVSDADLERIVAAALTDPSAGGNPREMTAANTRALLESCF
jgi:alcohol dehydrogenase class IV